jgi:hypothetical protein
VVPHLIHPERMAGVVLVGANYAGRGVVSISTAPERAQLPIRGLQGDRDAHLTALNAQWEMATTRAAQQRYRNIARTMLPNAPPGPFPDDVFNTVMNMRTSKP